MEQHRFLQSQQEQTASTGKLHFDRFVDTYVNQSHIPEEFYNTVANLSKVVSPDNSSRIRRETAKQLLSIDCRTEKEASYILSMGVAISLVKKYQSAAPDEAKKAELRRKAELSVGILILSEKELLSRYLGTLGRFSKRSREKAINRVFGLWKQLEQQVSDQTIRAKITSPETPRKT